ncbi:MAG TPA: PD-(D/E)XK nuclease family protein, partial [Usitatibacteraceae bacterium]|nr:PD-(D/E)XK nuclease family protein [Usitatibacteraceae bacterium]
GRLGALGVVAGTMTAEAARRHLRQFCLDTVFQPESGEAPVQVLGLLESVGLEFDALWVTGLTDDAWPQSPRPNPFLPVALQRKAGIPQASAEASLELDRRITQSWASAAPEVVLSHGLVDDERALAASPLLAQWPRGDAAEPGVPGFDGLREALFAAGRASSAWREREDRVAPALQGGAARGGTAILADQAACPFRAFARHRLRAEGLDKVEPGLGPSERGQLLHLVMARLWRSLGDQAALAAMDAAQLDGLVAEAARAAVARMRAEHPGRLEGRFARLEQERLARAALEWLAIDRARAPFSVVLREDELAIEAGGLAFRGRVDRMDRLASGGLAVIDYKTGSPAVAGWLGDRPDDPQLPLYALAAGEEVRAVAFACLKKGKHGFLGLAREEGLLPGVGTVDKHRTGGKLHASWDELLDAWRQATARLAAEFAAGQARVDPKKRFASCTYCDLSTLCRVSGESGPADAEEAGDDEEQDE